MPKNKYQDSTLNLVGSIWKNESNAGKTYLSIMMEDPEDEERKFKLVAFKNKNKKKDSQPDYLIFFDTEKNEAKKNTDEDFEDDFDDYDDI
jgi:uncharacterized protein (DUF736 family)